MSNTTRRLIKALVGIGLTLILAGMVPLLAAQEDEPAATPETEAAATAEAVYDTSAEPIEPTGDNGYCLLCHSTPLRTLNLANGEILNLYVSAEMIAGSVHGTRNESGQLGCLDCHGEESFPHTAPVPGDARTYTLDAVAICASCHTEQVDELETGLHSEAIRAGNLEAAVCTDCHGAHDVIAAEQHPQLVAGVCGDCHTETLEEWRVSDHDEIGPQGCGSCHSPHSQRLRVGETANELCLNCHKEEDIPQIFVHEQHAGAEIECVDCHMFVEETPAEGIPFSDVVTSTGHSMQLDSTPCNTCHEELVASGEWAQLVSDREATAETEPDEPAEAEHGETTTTVSGSYIQLIQGLILGLGFGATFAAVFVARGNRLAEAAPETIEPAPEAPAAPAEAPAPPAKPEDEGTTAS